MHLLRATLPVVKPFVVFRVAGLMVALAASGCSSYVEDVPASAAEVDFDGSQ